MPGTIVFKLKVNLLTEWSVTIVKMIGLLTTITYLSFVPLFDTSPSYDREAGDLGSPLNACDRFNADKLTNLLWYAP